MRECALGDEAAIAEAVKQLQPRKPPSGYMHAVVGVYPAKRLVRKHTLELKKLKEPTYMADLFTQQLRIEPEKFMLALINATDGADYQRQHPCLWRQCQCRCLWSDPRNQ